MRKKILRKLFFVIIAALLTIMISAGIGYFTYNVTYDILGPPSYLEEVMSEPLDQDIYYDVFAESLENKFSEMESVFLGGAGAGGLGSAQAYVNKEEFINQTVGKVFYSERIVIDDNKNYYFVQTYWTVNDNILLIYEKVYTSPNKYYYIEKGENELIYHLYNSSDGWAKFWGIIAFIISVIILYFIIERFFD